MTAPARASGPQQQSPAALPAGTEPTSARLPVLARVPQAALPVAGLVGAALGTAIAGLHLSRAHGAALGWHALAGVLGLLLALAAVLLAGHHARRSRTWTRLAVGTALVATAIAAVDGAMLCWYAFARVLGGM